MKVRCRSIHTHRPAAPRPRKPRRAATAVIAMLFLVLFSTLGLAMYSMATLNIQGADNMADNDRARAAAESGLRWITWRFTKMARPKTPVGNITAATAAGLWPAIRTSIINDLNAMKRSDERGATWDGVRLKSAPIRTWANTDPADLNDTFQLTFQQHPVYTGDPMDARYIRVTSTGRYGSKDRLTVKSLSLDFKIDKKVKFALVGKVPIQVGRNTLVEGPIAMMTANKYPPVLMLSDFKHLTDSLKSKIDAFESFVETNHKGYDGRIYVNNPEEFAKATQYGYKDYNGDSFIDEYDLFLNEFDKDGDKAITTAEFTDPVTGKLYDADLFRAIDTLGGPLSPNEKLRPGLSYAADGSVQGDGRIDASDGYSKVRGQITLATTSDAWKSNLGSGTTINDMMQGPIIGDPASADPAVKFGIDPADVFDLSPSNFDTSGFRLKTGPENGPTSKTATVITNKVLASTDANGGTVDERTPYGSTSYQATYRRPKFSNMTFKNVRIPQGLNALFENCTFEGVTFVELTTNITNSSGQTTTSAGEGMNWSKKMVSGSFSSGTVLTSANSYGFQRGNNLRFNNCTIKGPLVSDVPTAYTHFTNSWEFTGATLFKNEWQDPNTIDPNTGKGQTTATIIGPQTNIEMGSFTDPSKAPSTLKGVVVAGNIDIRGSSLVDGSIIVTGDGAGNTTQGWFGPSDGDTSTTSPMPEGGFGHLNIRYNPTLALPDGINTMVDILPAVDELNQVTYSEGQ